MVRVAAVIVPNVLENHVLREPFIPQIRIAIIQLTLSDIVPKTELTSLVEKL